MFRGICIVWIAVIVILGGCWDAVADNMIDTVLEKVSSPVGMLLEPSRRTEPVVVTATRYEDPSAKVGSNVTVIDSEDIRLSRARSVTELLRQCSGVNVSDFLGNGKSVRVDFRGFGDSASSNVLVLVDGRRTNQIDLSGADWTQIDVNSIDRIEVIRGPETVLYGDNASAGVINILTKKGGGKEKSAFYRQEAGSYRYSLYEGGFEGGSDFMDYFFSASTSYTNGHRINSKLETVDYSGNVTLKPSDEFKMKLYGAYHKDWYGLPGAVKPVDINRIGIEGSVSPDNRAWTEDFYFMATPEIKAFIFDDAEVFFSSDIVMRGRRTGAMYYSVWGDSVNTHHIKTFGATPKVAFTKEFYGAVNRIMAGLDFYSNTDEINSGLLSGPDSLIISKDTLGVYLTDRVELPHGFMLDAGARGEWAWYKFDQEAVVTGKHTQKPFEYAYSAALSYLYNDKSSVYFKYDRSYRFPSTDEWYTSLYIDYFSGLIAGGLNLDLKPQRGHNYEIGIKENSLKHLRLKADYFFMDLRNEIYYNPITYKNSSYPRTMRHGLELDSEVFIFDGLDIFMNYSFQKAFFVGDTFAGNEVPLVPNHKLSAGVRYTFMDCLTFTYGMDFVGDRYFVNDLQNIQPKMKSYTVHQARVSYKKYGFELFFAVNNIFDTQYSEYGVLDTFTLSMPGYYPAPGRNYTCGLNFSF